MFGFVGASLVGARRIRMRPAAGEDGAINETLVVCRSCKQVSEAVAEKGPGKKASWDPSCKVRTRKAGDLSRAASLPCGALRIGATAGSAF